MTVLLVEDDPAIVAALSSGIASIGLSCEVAASAAAAVDRLATGDVIAVVLDLDVAALGVVDFMRARRMLAPVVVLAGPANVAMCVNALDRGVDDYVTKPFDPEELLARLRAILRRSASPRWAPLTCNGVTLLPKPRVQVGADEIALSPTEYALLELLLRHQAEVVTFSTIIAELRITSERSSGVSAHVTSLRAKLNTDLVEIESIRSIGYRLRPSPRGGSSSR